MISEADFIDRLKLVLEDPEFSHAEWVTGPGRTGAMAAIYASHILNVSFVAYGHRPKANGYVLVMDILNDNPRTMRRALKHYDICRPIPCIVFPEIENEGLWFEQGQTNVQIFRRTA